MPSTIKFCPQCGNQNGFDAQFCFACGLQMPLTSPPIQGQKKNSNRLLYIIIFGAVFGCGGFSWLIMLGSGNKGSTANQLDLTSTLATRSPTQSVSTLPKATPVMAPDLVVVKSTWSKGGFDTVAIWRVTFKNNSSLPIGDIKYRTAYYSETGNQVDKGGIDSVLGKGVIQKVIPPKSTRTIEVNDGFTHSEAHRANFELVSWQQVSDRR